MTDQDNSNEGTLSDKHLSAIYYIIATRTMAEAAEKAGISRNTLYEWLKIPAFKTELQQRRDLVVEEAMERLESNVVKAVDTLGALLDNPNTHIYYKRNVSLDIIKHVMKTREHLKIAHLEKRISDLEKQLSEQTGHKAKQG